MDIKFLSYNVKGLNSLIKRHKILKELHLYKADVVSLQETHLTIESNTKLYSRSHPIWYYADTVTRQARGVAIGFSRDIRFELTDRLTDPEGRFLLLKGKLRGMNYTLANIYAPNDNSAKYVNKVLRKLENFKEGHLIVMGDFNFCMDPTQDQYFNGLGVDYGLSRGGNGKHYGYRKGGER